MDNIDLKAYIAVQKNNLEYYQQELNGTISLQNALIENKPIKWYNNTYYLLKRSCLFGLALILIFTIIFILISNNQLKLLFDDYIAKYISTYINEIFGAKLNTTIQLETPYIDGLIESKEKINVKESIHQKLTQQAFYLTKWFIIIVLAILATLFLYISRLTKKMHDKNKIIEAYYNSTLHYVEYYKNVVTNQKKTVEYLIKMSKKL